MCNSLKLKFLRLKKSILNQNLTFLTFFNHKSFFQKKNPIKSHFKFKSFTKCHANALFAHFNLIHKQISKETWEISEMFSEQFVIFLLTNAILRFFRCDSRCSFQFRLIWRAEKVCRFTNALSTVIQKNFSNGIPL